MRIAGEQETPPLASVRRLGTPPSHINIPKSPLIVGVALIAYYFISGPDSYQVYLATTMITFYIVGLGLDVIFGYAGQISLGSAGFFAMGAYLGAGLAGRGHDTMVVMVVVLLAGVVVGLLLGFVAQRLSGFGFAIVTWGFAVVVHTVILAAPSLTGGQSGLAVPFPVIFGKEAVSVGSLYLLGAVAAVIFTIVNVVVARSRVGRNLLAIKTNPVMARSVGISPVPYRVAALAYAGATASVAGLLFAYGSQVLAPSSVDASLSVTFLALVVVGGVRSVAGVALGTVIVVWLPSALQATAELSAVIFGIALILALRFGEDGIVGIGRSVWHRLSSRTPTRLTEAADGDR